MTTWEIFTGRGEPHDALNRLPLPPPWRKSSEQSNPNPPPNPPFNLEAEKDRGAPLKIDDDLRRAVNAALFLRRPLLVTGRPGVGKSSLISAVAYELRLGPVLRWAITSRSTVRSGLYEYDAIGRLHAQQFGDGNLGVGDFLRLGPLGTALYPCSWPRALLIDEIDKGDLDLPNDLLNVLEEGHFEIPELSRANEETIRVKLMDVDDPQPITKGVVTSKQFPFIVMTSNGEREFPAPFLRRCIRITIAQPTVSDLSVIVQAHLGNLDKRASQEIETLIQKFVSLRDTQQLATDQLLNAAFMVLDIQGRAENQLSDTERDLIVDLVLKQLTTQGST